MPRARPLRPQRRARDPNAFDPCCVPWFFVSFGKAVSCDGLCRSTVTGSNILKVVLQLAR